MRTTNADIRSLIGRIERGEIRLPEIQRGYVWKPPKVAGLIDSLYRRYPSGSLLLWETVEDVVERGAAIDGPGGRPLNKPQYLIDGQQRLTSLHRVFKGHEAAQIVFNVETERFQNESAATKKDVRWLRVHELLSDEHDTYSLVNALRDRLPELDPGDISRRLDRVRKIADYAYHVEILDDLPYEEVADIFVRVNSRGVPLRSVDLALATLSARWRGVIAKLDEEADRWAASGYGAMNVAFHLVRLLKQNAGIATSDLIPSDNALVPLVALLGLRPDEALSDEDADALMYWLFAAFIQGRYSGSTETVLGQDLTAIRSAEPIANLFRNLRLFGQRLVVTEDALVGRTERSPYFLLSYLAARKAGARDWWHGVDICTDAEGHFRLEYHHVHPRATLRDKYTKTEINDLANLAFISGKANRKISDRSPVSYFPEIGEEQLEAHFVPLDDGLRVPDRYPEFVLARRKLLAEAMTSLLDDFAPPASTGSDVAEDPAVGERLSMMAFGDSSQDPRARLVFHASAGGASWEAGIAVRDVQFFLSDLESGYSSGLSVGGETLEVEAGADAIELPLGPLLARGTLGEWRAVLERELSEIAPHDERPEIPAVTPFQGSRVPFPVIDSE